MTDVLQFPGALNCAFDHLVGYGVLAIAESSGYRPRLRWTDSLNSTLEISGLDWSTLADLVHRHALDHSTDSWLQAEGSAGRKKEPETKALFSPRVPRMDDPRRQEWSSLRERHIDELRPDWQESDASMIGALGEPSYWSRNRQNELQPDHGASPWEMKTRNAGEEFVGHRLRKLATTVAARTVAEVESGLRGVGPIKDEAGNNSLGSRTPTGLKPPQATDNARAWCALFGLSLLGVTPQQHQRSQASGYLWLDNRERFYLPVSLAWSGAPRLRTILRSQQLRLVAQNHLPNSTVDHAKAAVASRWLSDRGVSCVVEFPVHRSSNVNAPERWAGTGQRIHLDGSS